ncbi:putative glycosyltransferase [Methanomicrobium sp. W14]|uniref:DUF354 domain-containing protein n=1 Tax=Methanomicrobium sp. W14 TaxID=2817839 RepID=UPI001AE4FB7A|nr:DUF354 domain-containing protein [Methanomicrobium sp. W14]MBP2133109.1 putative glycosyltransferase [Methanomicrobium sp. W14]
MRIVVDINHPAHVHYFKNFIWEMEKRGHDILVTASEKEISYQLLNIFGIDYISLGSYGSSLSKKLLSIPILDLRMYRAVKRFKPNLFIGFGSIRAAHVSKILGVPSIALDDTEHAKWEHRLYVPFTDVILTPTSFGKDFGGKQIYYNGYTELAYLHPNYFTPKPVVLTELGLTEDDLFIIVRFVSWQASHDVGQHGIRDKVGLVKELKNYGRVLITSEGTLPEELMKYQIQVSPEKLHDLLYYATLYVGEGGTTATEAATLGTHAIHISTTAKYCGIFYDLNKYGLLWTSESDEETIQKAIKLLQDLNLKSKGQCKRSCLINDKIDVTAFMVWFIENCPRSVQIMKTNPDFQNKFQYRGLT